MFTVSTPATSLGILSLAEIKAKLGISEADTSRDAQLTGLNLRIADLIAGECRVPGDGVNPPTLLRETITETVRVTCYQQKIILARRPVVSITSVTELGTALTAEQYEVEASPALLYRLNSDERVCWPEGKVTVVYTAGWTASMLRTAALFALSEVYSAESRDPLLRSETVEGVGRFDYWTGGLDPSNGSALSNQARALLDPFRYHPM